MCTEAAEAINHFFYWNGSFQYKRGRLMTVCRRLDILFYAVIHLSLSFLIVNLHFFQKILVLLVVQTVFSY